MAVTAGGILQVSVENVGWKGAALDVGTWILRALGDGVKMHLIAGGI